MPWLEVECKVRIADVVRDIDDMRKRVKTVFWLRSLHQACLGVWCLRMVSSSVTTPMILSPTAIPTIALTALEFSNAMGISRLP